MAGLQERDARRDHLRRVAARGLALERDVALAGDVEAVPVRAAQGAPGGLERAAAVRATKHALTLAATPWSLGRHLATLSDHIRSAATRVSHLRLRDTSDEAQRFR